MIIGAVNKQREKRGSEKSRRVSVRAGECVVGGVNRCKEVIRYKLI